MQYDSDHSIDHSERSLSSNHRFIESKNILNSPVKKRSRAGHIPTFLKTFGGSVAGRGTSTTDGEDENGRESLWKPSLFDCSQDSNADFIPASQFSQDFADRLGEMNVQSQDYSYISNPNNYLLNQTFNSNSDGCSIPYAAASASIGAFNDSDSNSFAVPLSAMAPTSSSSNVSAVRNGIADRYILDTHGFNNIVPDAPRAADASSMQKEIPLASPMKNPFIDLSFTKSPVRRRPRTMWISAFRERPRLIGDFDVLDTIGEGVFSVVYKACCRLDGMVYAIKKIKKSIHSEKEGHFVVKEACALAALTNGPNIIRYFGCWLGDGHLHIQTELCTLGSLDLFVLEESSGSSSKPIHYDATTLVWVVLFKLSQTLEYMHSRGIVHLDIRPANIFITEDNIIKKKLTNCATLSASLSSPANNIIDARDAVGIKIISGEYHLKLGDFGHCRLLEEDNLGDDVIIEGEIKYCPRELIVGSRPFDLTKADVFSLGASVYEMCLGESLNSSSSDDSSNQWHDIRNGRLSSVLSSSYDTATVSVITQMLLNDPSLRPTAATLLSTSFEWLRENGHQHFSLDVTV